MEYNNTNYNEITCLELGDKITFTYNERDYRYQVHRTYLMPLNNESELAIILALIKDGLITVDDRTYVETLYGYKSKQDKKDRWKDFVSDDYVAITKVVKDIFYLIDKPVEKFNIAEITRLFE